LKEVSVPEEPIAQVLISNQADKYLLMIIQKEPVPTPLFLDFVTLKKPEGGGWRAAPALPITLLAIFIPAQSMARPTRNGEFCVIPAIKPEQQICLDDKLCGADRG